MCSDPHARDDAEQQQDPSAQAPSDHVGDVGPRITAILAGAPGAWQRALNATYEDFDGVTDLQIRAAVVARWNEIRTVMQETDATAVATVADRGDLIGLNNALLNLGVVSRRAGWRPPPDGAVQR